MLRMWKWSFCFSLGTISFFFKEKTNVKDDLKKTQLLHHFPWFFDPWKIVFLPAQILRRDFFDVLIVNFEKVEIKKAEVQSRRFLSQNLDCHSQSSNLVYLIWSWKTSSQFECMLFLLEGIFINCQLLTTVNSPSCDRKAGKACFSVFSYPIFIDSKLKEIFRAPLSFTWMFLFHYLCATCNDFFLVEQIQTSFL